MSNIRNMNQANNPFWDFVASMQNNPGAFPFGQGRGQEGEFDPFDGHFWGPFGGFGGPMPQRGGRHGPPGHGRRGPPPPPEGEGHESRDSFDGPPAPPSGPEGHGPAPPHGPPSGPHGHAHHHGKHPRGPPSPREHDNAAPPPPPPFEEPLSRSPTPPTPPETPAEPHHHPRPHGPPGPHGPHGGAHRGPPPHHRRGGRCGGRGGFGPRGGHHGSHGPHGPHHGPRRGGPGGPGGPNFPFDLSALAEAFAPGLFNNANNNDNNTAVARNTEDGTFTPEVDVFDTTSAYIIHASLPGAKKSELDITYNASRNSISISGVVMRPGVDEELMSALALDERKVGSFEREIRLDEKVKIDEDSIGAKLEDGVLRVMVPKIAEDEEEYVTVKKVELE